MFDDGRHDDVARSNAKAVGEMVQSLGGIPADDCDVVSARHDRRTSSGVACVFVGRGGELGLVPRTPVDARVPGDELLDSAEH